MTKDNQKLIDCNNDLRNIKDEIEDDNELIVGQVLIVPLNSYYTNKIEYTQY